MLNMLPANTQVDYMFSLIFHHNLFVFKITRALDSPFGRKGKLFKILFGQERILASP